MALKSFKVEKLIRDHLPCMMRAKGIVVHERVMEQEEFIQRLKEKLLEEADEVKQASHADELLEELADVLEVIQTLSAAAGLSMRQIEDKRIEKRNSRGGFEGRVFNHRVDMEEDNQAIAYYLNKREQYPAIRDRGFKHDCLFCQMASETKEVIFFAKFQHCYIIKDQFPVSPGHLLIIPYEHTDNWFTASEEVRLDIMKALSYAKDQLDHEYSPQGYNIGANCEAVAGQSVMHLHVHLIPRYLGDMEDPKGGVRGVIPSKQKY